MQQTQPPSDFTVLGYRLEALERDIKQLQVQLANYVPVKENELQLRDIQKTIARIETEITKTRDQITEISNKLIEQERHTRTKEEEDRRAADQLQIRYLLGILGALGVGLITFIVGYVLHFFH